MMKILAILAILFIGLLAMPVEAHHKPGHTQGGGNGGGPSSGASMTVTPNPVTAGETYTVHGTGFEDFSRVYLSVASPGCCSGSNVFPVNGEWDFIKEAGAPGTYKFTALVFVGKQGRPKILATLEFQVLP